MYARLFIFEKTGVLPEAMYKGVEEDRLGCSLMSVVESTRRARSGDFHTATTGDLYLATTGDFSMATDTCSTGHAG